VQEILRGSSMMITQIFKRGEEDRCGEEFFALIPDDPDLQESLASALDCVLRNISYKEYFTMVFDTEKRSVDVVEAL